MNRNIFAKFLVGATAVAVALPLMADTETVNGYRWVYRILEDGTAKIYNDGAVAISPKPNGAITIPASFDGKPVTSIGTFAFYDCENLSYVVIPNSVVNIEAKAFEGCWWLTSVTIPSSVTNIDAAFFNSGLTSMKIPDSVTRIGACTFFNCHRLSVVTIPNSVTSIGGQAFSHSGLVSVTIPDSVTDIGSSAFADCRGLTNATIGNAVTSIGDHAFYNCDAMTNISFGTGLLDIGEFAFYKCISLNDITIPDGITNINDSAFSLCWGLTNVTIGSGVIRIGGGAFDSCTNLESVTIPSNVKSIGDWAFCWCDNLKSISIGNGLSSTFGRMFAFYEVPDRNPYTGRGTINYSKNGIPVSQRIGNGGVRNYCIPAGLSHVSIGCDVVEGCFENCTMIKTIELKRGVTNIGDYACCGCTNLSEVTFPDGVGHIGAHSFENCIHLQKAELPLSATRIDTSAFSGCIGLKNVIIPDSVKSIENYAFNGCSNVTSVTIPQIVSTNRLANIFDSAYENLEELTFADGVTDIGDDVCAGCINLTKVVIPQSVKEIATNAFVTCSNLTEVTMPWMPGLKMSKLFPDSCGKIKKLTLTGSIDHIPAEAFKGCKSLTTVEIPKTVKWVGASAFEGCESLTGLDIPDGVGDVGASAFKGCKALKDPIELPNGVTNIGASAFADCTGLEAVDWHWWPWRINEIPSSLFKGCTGLKRVDGISSNIGRIGASVFEDCESLSGILLPSSVTNMGSKVFQGCSDLSSAQLPSNLKSIPDYTFNGCGKLTSVTMPSAPTSIGKAAFFGCLHKTEITIPETVKKIGDQAFGNCWALRRLDIPAGVSAISTRMCEGCIALSLIEIPSGVTTVSDYAFAGCTNLTSLTLPGTVTGIGTNALVNCINLKTIQLDDRTEGLSVVSNSIPKETAVVVAARNGFSFVGWEDEAGTALVDPFHMSGDVMAFPIWREIGGGEEPGGGEPESLLLQNALDNTTLTFTTGGGLPWFGQVDVSNDGVGAARSGAIGDLQESWLQTTVSGPGGLQFYWHVSCEGDNTDTNRDYLAVYVDDVEKARITGIDNEWKWKYLFIPSNGLHTVKWVYRKDSSESRGDDAGFVDGVEWLQGCYITYNSGANGVGMEQVDYVRVGQTSLRGETFTRIGYAQTGWATTDGGAKAYDLGAPYTANVAVTLYPSWTFTWGGATIEFDTDPAYATDEGGAFSLNLANCIHAASTPRLTVKGLPTGLKFDSKAGVISGKATKPGVYKVTVSATNATVKKPVTATFDIVVPNLASEVLPGLEQETDAYGVVTCGVAFDPGLVDCAPKNGWTVKVAGLPAGLKYDAKTGKITGVPTKAGTYTVTFTASKKGEANQVATITLNVEAAPEWAIGTFSGYVTGTGNGERGTASMTVAANGKISGKIALDGTNWTFKADSYSTVGCRPSNVVDGAVETNFVITAAATAGKAKREIELRVADGGAVARDARPYLVYAKAEGEADDGEWSLALWRGMWKDKSTAATAKKEIANREGVYTLLLAHGEGGEYGSGYLSLTVGKDGNVKATGKLADGTSVSATSPLMYDEDAGWFVYLYAAPSAYKGGAFAAAVGFDVSTAVSSKPTCRLQPVMFTPQWSSKNPLATGAYGAGFDRDVSFVGAYYDKLDTLRKYYESLRLSFDGGLGDAALPELGYVFKDTYFNDLGRKTTASESMVANAVDTLWQEGLTATVNEKGAIVVAKATKPVQDKETKEWAYNGSNDGALTLSFTQATGIFKGSYTFWYDYESAYDYTTGKSTVAHTSKKVSFEGILVQGDEPKMDGFYLWDATGAYEDEKTGKAKTYKYKTSFPVSLKP